MTARRRRRRRSRLGGRGGGHRMIKRATGGVTPPPPQHVTSTQLKRAFSLLGGNRPTENKSVVYPTTISLMDAMHKIFVQRKESPPALKDKSYQRCTVLLLIATAKGPLATALLTSKGQTRQHKYCPPCYRICSFRRYSVPKKAEERLRCKVKQ